MEILELSSGAKVDEQAFFDCMRAPGRPMLVRGAIADWPASKLWTFEYFSDNYGDQVLDMSDCLLRPTCAVQATVRDYLAYVRNPDGTRLHDVARAHRLTVPLYAYGCKPFVAFPELLAHFSLPPYADDWCERMPDEIRYNFYPHGQPWLLFSGTGARSVLHRDDGATIAWFAQIRGRKSFVVHPHADGPLVYNGEVDPLRPDLARFPLYARAHPLRFDLGENDLLFLPPDWYHFVRTESPSITLTGNIVNHVNFGDYVRFVYKDAVPAFLALMASPVKS